MDSFVVCAENYVHDFVDIKEPTLKQHAVYALLKKFNFSLYGENNSIQDIQYCKLVMDNSFVDPEVEQIKIFLYLLDADIEFVNSHNDGNNPCGCCDGYSTTDYYLGDPTCYDDVFVNDPFGHISYTVSETRFSEHYTCGYMAETSFNTIADCIAAVKKLKESGDIETNPGPVYSKPIQSKPTKYCGYTKKEYKRQKKEFNLFKKLMKEHSQRRVDYELSKKFDECHYQMFGKQVLKSCLYAGANYVVPCAGTALATGIEGASALDTMEQLKVTSTMLNDAAEKVSAALPKTVADSEDIARLSKNTLVNLDWIMQCLKDRVEQFSMFSDCRVNPLHFCIIMILAYITFSHDSIWTGIPMILMVMHMFEWDELLINKIRQICGLHYEMNMPINILGQIIFTIIAYCGIGSIPTDKWYDSIIRRLDSIPKAVIGSKNIWDTAGSVFETCEKEFKIFFLGYHKEDLYLEESLYTEVKEWADRISYHWNMPNRKEIAKDIAAVQEIERMFSQMNHWLHTTAIRKSLPKDVLQIILSLRPQMNELFKLYCKSTVHEGGPRKLPLCALFTGGSHHGKSEMLMPLAFRLLYARGYTDPEQAKKEIYTRTVETDFWDNYVGQKLVLCDDAFQIKDSLGKPSIEYMESIRLINTAPAQVHCADVSDKGTYFSSEIVLYTSNLHHGFVNYINSLNCPEAAMNRLNTNAFRVHTQPKFEILKTVKGKVFPTLNKKKLGWSKAREEQYQKLKLEDPDLKPCYCEDCKSVCEQKGLDSMPFCPHHYRFERYDIMTDQQIGNSMTFNQVIEHLCDYDEEIVQRETEKLAFYDKFAASPLMFEMKTEMDNLLEETYADAESVPSALDDIGYIDMTLPSNITMYAGLQRAKAYFNEKCEEGKFKDPSPDNFARFLMQTPELFAFYEKTLCNPTNYDDAFRREQERTRENARLEYLFTYFFLGTHSNYFQHVPGDFSDAKDRYFINLDFVGFVKEVTAAYDIMPIYVENGQELLAYDLVASDTHDLYINQKLKLEDLSRKNYYDSYKFVDIPVNFWKKSYASICKKLTAIKESIKNFYKECSFFTILGFFSITLALIGLVWKFMPSAEAVEEAPKIDESKKEELKKKKIEKLSHEALFGKCSVIDFVDDEIEILQDAWPIISAKFCFFKCQHCDYVKQQNLTCDCTDKETIIQMAKDIQHHYKESLKINIEPTCESAASSAEVKLNKKSVKTESSASSAEVQLNKKQIKTEADSGDDDFSFSIAKENDFSGSDIADLAHQGVLDTNCHAVIKSVTSRNMYLMHSDKQVFGNVLFLKGHTMMFNRHYPMLMKHFIAEGKLKRNDTLYLSNLNGMRISELKVSTFVDEYIPIYKTLSDDSKIDTDAALLTLDPIKNKVSVVHKDIIKYFLRTEEISLLSGKYRGVLPSFNNVFGKENIVPMYKYMGDIQGYFDGTKVIDINDFEQPIKYRNYWAYNCMTVGGDCGAPLFIENANLAHKIVGIHSAGGTGYSIGQLITQEMLNEGMSRVPPKYQCCVQLDMLGEEIDAETDMVGSVPVRDGLMVHGHLKDGMKVIGSSKTKITESDLYDQVSEHTTLPTLLGKTGDVDPMEKGLRKFGKYTPLIDPALIEICGNDVQNNLNANPSGKDKSLFARVLPYEEAVKGNEDDEFLAPINRKTSLGFPYTIMFDHPEGKKAAFGHEEWTLDTEQAKLIEKDVNTLIENASKGIQTGVYWTDTLKMERRSIEKVQDGKTRVFCAGPVHFTLAFRMYFLGFAAFLMHNRNFNEISTGTNVFSNDWDVIAKKILSRAQGPNGSNVGAGDFTNYDGSLSSQILWYILDMINEWYDDGEVNANIRRGLWLNIVNAIHINHSVIYQCTHSQPSGCPLTAVLNSIYNSIVVRIVYILIARDFCPEMACMAAFEKSVTMVAYGDDNLIGIHHSIVSWFNMNNISKYFLIIGHEYTDESKSSQFVNVKDLSECAYLKRKFIYNAVVNRCVAPLDITVILEIPQWTKKGLLRDEIQLANLDVCMRELCLHDKDTFLHYSRLFKNKCVDLDIPFRFRTYEEYQDDVLNIPNIAFESGSDRNRLRVYELHIVDTKFSHNTFTKKLVKDGRLSRNTIRKCKNQEDGAIFIDFQNRIVHLMTDNFREKYISHIRSKLLDHYLDIGNSGLSVETMRRLRVGHRLLI
jgi:hypothetical protein